MSVDCERKLEHPEEMHIGTHANPKQKRPRFQFVSLNLLAKIKEFGYANLVN